VTDSNSAANQVAEGATANTLVGITATATLSKGNAKPTYSLSQGADAFAINPRTGAITVKDGTLLDYEQSHSQTLTVNAILGAVTSTHDYTVALTDVPDVPAGVAVDNYSWWSLYSYSWDRLFCF
jgi:hypothetical protein